MALTIGEVEAVAALARLELSDDEKRSLRDQLSNILEHIAVLERVDTSAIPPTAQVIPLTNVLRPDEVRPSLPRELALANAPRQSDGFFEVSAVLGSDPETA
jgi:aspartyl-tRNA(Asn)/glutamyl-tRNA(Gln) amidotransferase subunit C